MKTFMLLGCALLASVAAWQHNLGMLFNAGFLRGVILLGSGLYEQWLKKKTPPEKPKRLSLEEQYDVLAVRKDRERDLAKIKTHIHRMKEVHLSLRNAENRALEPQRVLAELRTAADTARALVADMEAHRADMEDRFL